ncbi:MAG: hypothetical protein H5T62_13265 [Anaerolineae bacterium]|nr:hypothetical protein [Anaerolineae bacterium]
MVLKSAFKSMGKIVVGAVVYYLGFILGSVVAGVVGMEAPPLPAGTEAQTLGMYQLVVSLIFAVTLAVLSRRLTGGFFPRWLVLALFSWVAYGLNTYLEAAIFTAYAAASAYTLVMQALAAVLCSAVIAWAFPPGEGGKSATAATRAFLSHYSVGQWAWRLLAAWAAFPLIYLIFGWLVQPFIIEFYRQQMAGLTLPGWGQILPTQALRSLLFLLACLPLLALGRGSRWRLFILLGSALFVFVGGLYMLQAYWYPATMRIAHSLEILADSFVYAAVLTVLLVKGGGDKAEAVQ